MTMDQSNSRIVPGAQGMAHSCPPSEGSCWGGKVIEHQSKGGVLLDGSAPVGEGP